VVYTENCDAVAAAMGVAQQYFDRADAEGLPTDPCGYRLTTLGYASRIKEELDRQICQTSPSRVGRIVLG
jgi:hypothetical protein